LFRLSSFSI